MLSRHSRAHRRQRSPYHSNFAGSSGLVCCLVAPFYVLRARALSAGRFCTPPSLSLSLSRSPRRPPAALVSPCSYFVYQAQAHDKGEAGNADEEQLEDLADQADAFDSELKHVAS